MAEQAPQINPDIANHPHLQEFPNAVQDPEKARFMAETSMRNEERFARHISDSKNLIGQQPAALNEAQDSIEKAKLAREIADQEAEYAAEVYDKVKG